MAFQIQMLGTGNAFAKKYFNNNALIQDSTYNLLVDFGITGPSALHAAGKSFNDINGVLISHLHGDHVGGMEELAFYFKYALGRKPALYIPEKLISTFWDHSLRAGLEDATSKQLEDYFEVVPLYEGQANLITEHIKVEIIETDHIPGKTSYSLLFNNQFFYSADMKFNPELLGHLHKAHRCDIIFHDCQFQPPGMVHTTLDELLTLPNDIQKKIHIMHYADDMENYRNKVGLMNIVEQGKIYTI
jgi:hydroxyacylglutathione hydrolase